MNGAAFILAAALNDLGELPLEVGASRRGPGKLDDIILIIGLVVGLTLILVVWAKFIRKSSRENVEPSRVLGTPDSSAKKTRSGERRRRSQQRFPTLAETGGLPPARKQSSSSGDVTHAG